MPAPAPAPNEPLPSPELLRYYEQIGGEEAVRHLMSQFVFNAEHRRQLQKAKQQQDYDLQRREQRIQWSSQFMAFIVAMSGIVGGLWLAGIAKHPWTGAVLSGGTVVSLVYAFVRTRKPVVPPFR